jgi:hypothetical protein
MLLAFFYHARFLSVARLKFEENLYLRYVTESIYRFLPHFPVHYSLVILSFDAVAVVTVFFQTVIYSQHSKKERLCGATKEILFYNPSFHRNIGKWMHVMSCVKSICKNFEFI